MHGTEWQMNPEYKLKLNYPVKPENLKKSLKIGYTSGVFTMYPKRKNHQGILDDVIPKRNFDGLKLWFHDAFEMLHDQAINLHARKLCYLKILITPKATKIDTSIKDFDFEQ